MAQSTLIRWLVLGGALLATIVASVWRRDEMSAAPQIVAPTTRHDAASPDLRKPPAPSALPKLGEKLDRPSAAEKVQDLFGSTSFKPPPAPQRPPPPVAPTAPPFPYAISGSVVDSNGLMIVLNKDDQDFVLKVGDVLEQTYRIEAIDLASVTVTYLPLGLTQTVMRDASR